MTSRTRLPRRRASFVNCRVWFVPLAGRAYCRIWRRDARRAKALSLVGLVVVLAPRAASHRSPAAEAILHTGQHRRSCGNPGSGAPFGTKTKNETIAHFLLHCPMYAFERWALAKHAKKRHKEFTVETLLGDPELAIPLANYMDGTGRFRTKIGEHPQSQIGNTAQENTSR